MALLDTLVALAMTRIARDQAVVGTFSESAATDGVSVVFAEEGDVTISLAPLTVAAGIAFVSVRHI